MLTDEQLIKLTTINFTHDSIFEWVRIHATTIPYEELTSIQQKTLQLIANMNKVEQGKYVIIDDMLVETPTNVENYTKIQGKWEKRDGRMPLQYSNRKL